jgi:predicted HicB family RNase H-like nuclease
MQYTNNLTNLNIRRVPRELARQIKSAAAAKGITLRQWAIEAFKTKLTQRSETK